MWCSVKQTRFLSNICLRSQWQSRIRNGDLLDELHKQTKRILGITTDDQWLQGSDRKNVAKSIKQSRRSFLLMTHKTSQANRIQQDPEKSFPMRKLVPSIAAAVTITHLSVPLQASRGMPTDLETFDRLWQQYNTACRQGDQRACQLRDNYQDIIKQNFPNAVPASCPPPITRVWFETGRKGMAAGCQML